MMLRHPRVLAIILAGGQGGRMDVLTEQRAKPVMPFGGAYRLIDFPLSNCVNSRLHDVWVVEQYRPHGLNTHLANGRPWDLDRLYGGLRVLPPYQTRQKEEEDDGAGFAEGNADALWRNRAALAEFDADLLLVLSADHVYRMDYRDVIDWHLEKGDAVVTVVATALPPGESAARFGNVVMDGKDRITEFAYKPETPISEMVTTEVFVYDARRLLKTLDALAAAKKKNGDDAPLQDFGHELLPHLVREGQARAFVHEGYWRDVGTIPSYMAAHRDLLAAEPPFVLDDPAWAIRTFSRPRSPARIAASARVEDSLISPGCRIAGRVVRSVLSPGVIVEAGATVSDSLLFENVVVRAEATVRHAIVDEEARIGAGAQVGGTSKSDDRITLIGRRARIADGQKAPGGERVPPAGDGA